MNAVHLAEQATLGSLLLPGQDLVAVAASLRADDFAHPWHREVFATIRELHAAHEPHDAERVGRALTERLGHRRADLPRILDLLQAAPPHPELKQYAAMVLEESLRRTLATQGILLEAGALASARAQGSGPAHRAASLVGMALDDVERRWHRAGEGSYAAAALRQPPGAVRLLDRGLGADRLMRAHPPLDPGLVRQDEAALVAALVARPSSLPRVSAWLRPESLTHPQWRAVYTAALHLADSGRPVDVVTVSWEVRRTSRRMGDGPDLRELRRAVEDAAAMDPDFLGRCVAADHLRLTADRAATALRTTAANPGLDLVDVIETGRLVTAAVRDAADAVGSVDGESRAVARPTSGRDRSPRRSAAPALSVVDPVAG